MDDQQIPTAICSLLNEVDTTSTDRAFLSGLRERIASSRSEICSCLQASELNAYVAALDRTIFEIDVRICDLRSPRFDSILNSSVATGSK